MSKSSSGPGSHHPLLDLIKQLYSARELVVDAYERSGVDLDDKAMTTIEPLMKAHLLRKEGNSGIRLNQKLQKVFDSALRKNRIAAISTDLTSELQAAEIAMRQLQDIKESGRYDELMPARYEVEQHLLSIYDILDDSTTAIFNRVTSSYGMRSNPDIRARENELYNRQLTNLVESYNQMRSGLNEEPFTLDTDISSFIANLDIRCMEVVDRIRRTQNTIRDNLFRVRELENQARKIRAVADHLRHNPGFEATLTQDALDKHPFFRSITAISVSAVPDLTDPTVETACVDLVARLSETLKVSTPKAHREESNLRDATQEEHRALPSAFDIMVKRLLANCLDVAQPVSALAFWDDQEKPSELAHLHKGEWLYSLALYMDGNPLVAEGIETQDLVRLYVHAKPRHRLAGTHDLADLYLYPASMSARKAAQFVETHDTTEGTLIHEA